MGQCTGISIVAAILIVAASCSLGLAFSIQCHTHQRSNLAPIRASASDDGVVELGCYVIESSDIESDAENNRFSAQTFASSKCWGRRPFLMRGAFDPDMLLDNANSEENDRGQSIFAWPSWEEVVDIAADDDSESRIISHIPGDHASFDLQWGPLTVKDTRVWLSKPSTSNENRRKETLVVNDIDRFYPPLADWMHDTFRFLPNWRMDDGQISLAEHGGGIGPHVDNYDVFLVQMSGTRTWQVGRRTISAQEERDNTIDGLDVRVLSDRNVGVRDEQEMEKWIVYPGDLLYLPPRVPHCGTSLSSDCMTLSVGCRAPSVSDLVSKLAETLSSSIEDSAERRYTDSDLFEKNDASNDIPGELTSDAKECAKHLVIDSLTSLMSDDEWWDEFLGRYVTEQKRLRNNYPISLEDWAGESDCSDDGNLPGEWSDAKSTVQNVLAGNGALYQAEGIAFAHSSIDSEIHNSGTSHRFFANGEMWQSKSQKMTDNGQNSLARLFKIVSNHRRLDRTLLLGLDIDSDPSGDMLTTEEISFLEELISTGILYGVEE
mmetsp:Transcript_11217/g.27576  ORF Transcript_11217/g.27576 Transcript_11217/m.27576 type:complete len:547 (-) Transcript_11217:54-1694(-)